MSDPNTPAPAPNWYPDPHDASRLRYWDGTAWTDHFAPAAPVAAAPAAGTTPADTQVYAAAPAGPATGANTRRNLLIAGAVVVGVLVVGSIGAAIGGAGGDAEPAATVAPVTPTPTPEPVTPSPSPTPPPTATPTPTPVDPARFRGSANSHLDDMQKDLDDMVVTLDEGGFFRLLSNSVELSFNLGQLQSLDVPDSVATAYADSLIRLEASIDALSDPIAASDDPGTRTAIEAVRAEVEATRGVVAQAQ